MPTPPPTKNLKDPLTAYWALPVSNLTEVENSKISAEEAERHTIFSLLALALVADAFNGNKRGATGEYPWREAQKIGPGRYAGDSYGDRYFGHNIACLAVDGRGEIIDFEFNHNELYNSSAEHAEARLVRRIFNLNQAFDHWDTIDPKDIADIPYANLLSAVTIYTTLESCAQCSGIMTLGNVKSVVYLQSDPGQYRIGNIMYNLSNPLDYAKPSEYPPDPAKPPSKYGAPEPVSADLFGFSAKAKIEAAYSNYAAKVDETTPFFKSAAGKVDKSNSITSFLCTDAAKSVFDEAAAQLDAFAVQHAGYPKPDPGLRLPKLTNAEVLKQAKLFRLYAAKSARRATPHR